MQKSCPEQLCACSIPELIDDACVFMTKQWERYIISVTMEFVSTFSNSLNEL